MSTKANKTMYKEINISDVRERLIRKGYSEEQLQQCIDSYERMDVWMRTSGGTKLRWTEITEFDDEL
jgi:DNA replication licensing factor MCM7